MYGGGREKKTKRETKRSKQAAAAAAAEAEADDGAAPSGNKRDKWLKKDSEVEHGSRRSAAWQPPQGEVDGSLGEQVFMRWDEVLGAREGLKRRLDTIAAVHGWESRSARKCFLGGIEPGALVRSLRAEVGSLDAAAADLERADLVLQLQHVRRQLEELEPGATHKMHVEGVGFNYRIFVLHSSVPMEEQTAAFHAPPDDVVNIYLASTI